MHDRLIIPHRYDLLPTDVTHSSLRFDHEGWLLDSPYRGEEEPLTLQTLIPEFGALDPVLEELRSRRDALVQEPLVRFTEAGDERVYRARLRLSPVDEDGTAGLVLDVEDITELCQLRKEANHLRAQLQHLQAMVDMVAHDLNTPLTMLNGYLELASTEMYEIGNEAIFEYLHVMQGGVERIMYTVGQMFDVVSIEAGQFHLRLRTLPVTELLRRVARESRVIVDRRHQPLVVRDRDGLPDVLCDEIRVLQVFQNLISNASKYSPHHSSITLTATLDFDRKHVRFTISDAGPGIAAAQLPYIFERAFRVPGADTYARGAGLGLYLARIIVERHGGRIWCESVVGKGSDFHFTLPVASGLHDL